MEESTNMKRYVALLRGINISGKNKVPMAELKKVFEELGFTEVKTYLNSGNVIFSSEKNNIGSLTGQIETMIKNQFGLDIPVFVTSKEDLKDILHHAPDWWGTENKEIYDNLIFIMPPATFAEVWDEIGEPRDELEGSGILVFQSKRLSKDKLVAKDGKCGHQRQIDNKNGKHRQEDSRNVIAFLNRSLKREGLLSLLSFR